MGTRDVLATDWQSLSAETLVSILTAVRGVLSQRIVGGEPSEIPAPPVPEHPRARRVSRSSAGIPLRSPFACDFRCLFCADRCACREGYAYHSCYERRRRRQGERDARRSPNRGAQMLRWRISAFRISSPVASLVRRIRAKLRVTLLERNATC